MLVGLQRSSFLYLSVEADTPTYTPQSLYKEAYLGGRTGLDLRKERSPLLQRPQSTQLGSMPSVLGRPTHLWLLLSAHTVRNVGSANAENGQNRPPEAPLLEL